MLSKEQQKDLDQILEKINDFISSFPEFDYYFSIAKETDDKEMMVLTHMDIENPRTLPSIASQQIGVCLRGGKESTNQEDIIPSFFYPRDMN